MNLNNFTLKSQEVVQTAQQLAQQIGHQQIENEHLFKALLEVDDNVLPFVFKKLQVNFLLLEKLTDSALESLPKVSGGEIMLSPNASKTLIDAINLSKSSKDEF
jgi:ATP-dependent Clp protease ATP-binding subunit ClpB